METNYQSYQDTISKISDPVDGFGESPIPFFEFITVYLSNVLFLLKTMTPVNTFSNELYAPQDCKSHFSIDEIHLSRVSFKE
jgi:hypothetical protein